MQRTNPHAVAGQEQFLPAAIPDGQGELAVAPCQTLGAFLLVQVQQNLRIRCRVKAMALLDQSLFQLRVVEDLPVPDDPERLVFIVDRLTPARQVDDAQPHMPQTNPVVEVDPRLIRPPIPNRPHHPG